MEEIEKTLSPTVETLAGAGSRIWLEFLALVSVPQGIAIAATLMLAILAHLKVSKLFRRVFDRLNDSNWRRVSRTVASISMPIVWVAGLWLSLLILGELGWKTAMVRLVASLVNAWVVIRIASTVISGAG